MQVGSLSLWFDQYADRIRPNYTVALKNGEDFIFFQPSKSEIELPYDLFQALFFSLHGAALLVRIHDSVDAERQRSIPGGGNFGWSIRLLGGGFQDAGTDTT